MNTLHMVIQIRKLRRKEQVAKPGIYLISRAINKVSNLFTALPPNLHLQHIVFIGYITCTCLLYIKY